MNLENLEVVAELGSTETLSGKVRCISDYDNNWGSCDPIKGNLEVGNVYTIDRIEVHSWHTSVKKKGILILHPKELVVVIDAIGISMNHLRNRMGR